MARLYLFAEGQTEQAFADAVLRPHLANFGVYLHKPVLIAHAKKKGRVHRGGGRNYLPMKNDLLRFFKQEAGSDVYFTTMIDLYALPQEFPGRESAAQLRSDPYQRVRALEEAWAADLGDPRFLPFLQVHEFEAYLFADARQFALFYPAALAQLARLQQIATDFGNPELINDGQHSAPSKRIISEFPDYAAAKPVVGPQVGKLIGLAAIRAQCPHFHQWLSRLEGLAPAQSLAAL